MSNELTPDARDRLIAAIEREFPDKKTVWFFAVTPSGGGPTTNTDVITNAGDRKVQLPMWLRSICRGYESGKI